MASSYAGPIIQASLAVSAPGDRYEQEAEQVADRVMSHDPALARSGDAPPAIQRTQISSLSGEAGVGPVSPAVEQTIAQMEGGSPLPEQERSFFEERMGADFSGVRIHTAPDLAQSLNARAFTVGNNITFNASEYAPSTDAGRHLLAHELTHVLQQNGDAGAVARAIQRTPITTSGGEWDTDKYDIVDSAGTQIGVDIDLKFSPKAPTDATKIGMVQTANSINEGTPLALNATVAGRSIPSGEPGAGNHIDRISSYANPLYATENPAATDALGDTPTKSFWGRHGWRYTDPSGALQEEDAQLKDKPQLPNRGANASQIFETTALAVEGNQTGTYYGSVQWGWQTDSSGNFTQLPLSPISTGNPSDVFMRAAQLWNQSQTSTGQDTLDLPTTYDPGAAASLSTPALIGALREAKEQLAQLTAVPATTNKEFQVRQLEHELLRRNITVAVTAVRGDHDAFFAGSDDVYVKLTYGGRSHQTPEHDMDTGDTHSFQIALSTILPGAPLPADFALDGTMTIEVVDSDLIFDDSLTSLAWNAPFEPLDHNGGDYTVRVSFE